MLPHAVKFRDGLAALHVVLPLISLQPRFADEPA
jgi:hypothetical protein